VLDEVGVDDQVAAIIGNATNKDMDVGIVGVPVIDRDPVQPRAQRLLGPLHDALRGGAQV
jgi:hypothetical protein